MVLHLVAHVVVHRIRAAVRIEHRQSLEIVIRQACARVVLGKRLHLRVTNGVASSEAGCIDDSVRRDTSLHISPGISADA